VFVLGVRPIPNAIIYSLQNSMKLLVVSHAYAERANHKKLEQLAAIPDLKVGLIYPRKWRTWHGEYRNAQIPTRPPIEENQIYKEYPVDTVFTGDGGKYFYSPIHLIVSLLAFRPDIIYLEEEPFAPVALEVAFASLVFRKKLVFFTWENLDLPLGNLRNFIEKFTYSIASKAVAGNLGATERLTNSGFLKPTAVIPQFGVNVEMFRRFESGQSEGGVKPLTIGFVGRPSAAKGLDVLMRAVSMLDFDFRLLIITSSKEINSEFIDLAHSLKISERVQYKTSIPHSELVRYFNQMDVFVLPSRTTKTWKEQFGRTIIEAMACGVPVVGSSSGAIPEVVDTAGLIFKEEDSYDLREKLSLFRNEATRKEFSEAGSKRVSENYTYPIICSNLINFLGH